MVGLGVEEGRVVTVESPESGDASPWGQMLHAASPHVHFQPFCVRARASHAHSLTFYLPGLSPFLQATAPRLKFVINSSL